MKEFWQKLHRGKRLLADGLRLQPIMGAALADPHGLGGLRLKLWNLHVPKNYTYLFYAMPPGAVCIDCGANIGKFTDAVLHQGGVSYAFEPNATLFTRLSHKYAGNDSVRLVPAAVGAGDGTARFNLSANTRENPLLFWECGTLTAGGAGQPMESVQEVRVIDFAAFLKREFGGEPAPAAPPIYLIKLDIEGSEFEVVEKLVAEGLHKLAQHIVVETHARLFPDGEERLARLQQAIREAGADNVDLGWV